MEEEEIKKRLLAQKLQASMQEQQIRAVLKDAMSQILEKKARERLANLKTVKPQLAMQLELYLAQLYEAGQIKNVITDEHLVQILSRIGQKRDIKIQRK